MGFIGPDSRFWRHPWWTKAHRWLSLFAGVQVALWVVSGSVFVWLDLDDVHGDLEVRAQASPVLGKSVLSPPESAAVAALAAAEGRALNPTRVLLTSLRGRPVRAVYEGDGSVPVGLVDAAAGTVLTPLGVEFATALAAADYAPAHPIASVISVVAKGGDYRGPELPVWRVEFAGPKATRLYISPRSGRVLARRNDRWRLFDFFWMLHTMDYSERDDFNHPLIRIAALGALAVVLTGTLLVGQRFIKAGRKA